MALSYSQIYGDVVTIGGPYYQQILVALWTAVGPVYTTLNAGGTIAQDPASVRELYRLMSSDPQLPVRIGFLVMGAALQNDSDANVQTAINNLFPQNSTPFSF